MIKIEVQQKTAFMVIANPPVNALNQELKEDFIKRLKSILTEKEIWSIIITGEGYKYFAAGGDIRGLSNLDSASGFERVCIARRFYSGIANIDIPVIAAINGTCLGGGFELALACDIRIAVDHAMLGLPEVGLGIIPGAGGTQRLPQAVGLGWANYLLFTGEAITASKAMEIGLVQEVVSLKALRSTALALAEKINSKGPLAVRAAKRLAAKSFEQNLEKGLDMENKVIAELFETGDAREGISAFLEKRRPFFKGD